MEREGLTPDPVLTPQLSPPVPIGDEETLVSDSRAGVTPSEMVERKLVSLLNSTPLPFSRLQTTTRRRPPA
jgi:hypothetical protein